MGHAILPVDLETIAGAILLPEGYKLVSAQYDAYWRTVNFTVESDELPEDSGRLPALGILHSVEFHPDDHTFRKFTGAVKIIG